MHGSHRPSTSLGVLWGQSYVQIQLHRLTSFFFISVDHVVSVYVKGQSKHDYLEEPFTKKGQLVRRL